ncbi:hypothetical protein GC167_06895 [bacterium]|nr:hypothetical protein [bacterium]
MEKTLWNLDPMHSEATFKVRHMMVSNVTGHFKSFSATAQTQSDDLSDAQFSFEADVDSIDTRQSDRDAHLKSADFFDAANHPKISFRSTSVEKRGDKHLIKGDLTIRGTARPVELDLEFNGSAVDPYGNTKAGFEISGAVSRKEFGLQWNAVTEAGSVVVGDEVKILVNAQFVKV